MSAIASKRKITYIWNLMYCTNTWNDYNFIGHSSSIWVQAHELYWRTDKFYCLVLHTLVDRRKPFFRCVFIVLCRIATELNSMLTKCICSLGIYTLDTLSRENGWVIWEKVQKHRHKLFNVNNLPSNFRVFFFSGSGICPRPTCF